MRMTSCYAYARAAQKKGCCRDGPPNGDAFLFAVRAPPAAVAGIAKEQQRSAQQRSDLPKKRIERGAVRQTTHALWRRGKQGGEGVGGSRSGSGYGGGSRDGPLRSEEERACIGMRYRRWEGWRGEKR